MLIIKSPWASQAGLKHPQNVLVAKATATSYAFRKHAFQGARRSVQPAPALCRFGLVIAPTQQKNKRI